ncbi:hypothetical protein B0H11DRAFT_802500 [Mycena galericulata]|nr:hypothetical protein B0H11DRAFT_802500 [Mycena galericulata]
MLVGLLLVSHYLHSYCDSSVPTIHPMESCASKGAADLPPPFPSLPSPIPCLPLSTRSAAPIPASFPLCRTLLPPPPPPRSEPSPPSMPCSRDPSPDPPNSRRLATRSVRGSVIVGTAHGVDFTHYDSTPLGWNPLVGGRVLALALTGSFGFEAGRRWQSGRGEARASVRRERGGGGLSRGGGATEDCDDGKREHVPQAPEAHSPPSTGSIFTLFVLPSLYASPCLDRLWHLRTREGGWGRQAIDAH